MTYINIVAKNVYLFGFLNDKLNNLLNQQLLEE